MKKYLNQTTVNVIAIASAAAWGFCAISPSTPTRSNNGFSSQEAHAAFDDQMKANKFLDYEIARLRNCGELLQRGIYFSPDSPASWICNDVMID